MSTRINVNVGGGGLVARARQQQQEGRWAQGEREEQRRIATEAVDAALAAGTVTATTAAERRTLIANAERQLRLGNTSRLAPGIGARPASRQSRAQQVPAVDGHRPGVRVRREEPAANRKGSGAFMVIINVNAAMDDAFDVFLKTPLTGPLVKQSGSADFSPDGEITAYLWTTTGMSAEVFAATKPGKVITDYGKELASDWETAAPGIVWRGANRLTGVRPVRHERFYMEMVVTKANLNGNFGEILTGFIDQVDYGITFYEEGDLNVGEKIVIDDEFHDFWGGTAPQSP